MKEDLEAKRKLHYYKKIINPSLQDQNYFSILTNLKKNINIVKIKTNSHELHNETR